MTALTFLNGREAGVASYILQRTSNNAVIAEFDIRLQFANFYAEYFGLIIFWLNDETG